MKTYLVLFGDYSNDQKGYNSAKIDGAVHIVKIDEESYAAMYNVQQAIQATTECLGISVAIGLVKDGKYLSLSFVENTDYDPQHFSYESLNEAFDQSWNWHLDDLRKDLDDSLDTLAAALGECEERKTIDHCTDCIEQQRK